MQIVKRKIRNYIEMTPTQRSNYLANAAMNGFIYGVVYLFLGIVAALVLDIDIDAGFFGGAALLLMIGAAVAFVGDGLIWAWKKIAAVVAPRIKEWAYRD